VVGKQVFSSLHLAKFVVFQINYSMIAVFCEKILHLHKKCVFSSEIRLYSCIFTEILANI